MQRAAQCHSLDCKVVPYKRSPCHDLQCCAGLLPQISIGGKIEAEEVIEIDLRSVQESPIQWHKQRGSSCLVCVFREKNCSGLGIHSRVCLRAHAQTHTRSSTGLRSASVLALLQIHFNMRKCKPGDGEAICVTQGAEEKKCKTASSF